MGRPTSDGPSPGAMRNLPLTYSLKGVPSANFDSTLAAICKVSPVAGLRPSRAARRTDLNVPKPTKTPT